MVCPQDVEKDAVEASQDGLLEDMSKGGVWLERIPAMRRWKTSDLWTEKHLNVVRRMVVEGGRVWQRMYDTGWPDEKRWRGCNKKEGTEEKKAISLSVMDRSQEPDPGGVEMWEQGARTSKEDWEWQRGITSHALSGSDWRKSHLSVRKWESGEHRSWSMPVEGFRNHVATGGSSLEVSARCECVWVVSCAA